MPEKTQPKIVQNSVYDLYFQLNRKATKKFDRQITSAIPKDITIEQMISEFILQSRPLYEDSFDSDDRRVIPLH